MSLKNLLALQKQKDAVNAKPKTQQAVEKSESKPATSDGNNAESNPAEKPKALGLNLAGKATKPVAAPKKPAADSAKQVSTSAKDAVDSGDFSLDDLAGLEASSVAESTQEESLGESFEDEIEASAPDRALPEDLTDEMKAFVDSLDGVYQVLHDPDMFGQSVRMIMIELQENSEYDQLLADEDIHVMIRGMRRTMGLARVNKQSKKRGAATKKNARKKAGVSDDAMALLDGLMGGGTLD